MGKGKSNMSKRARIMRAFKEHKRLSNYELNKISQRFGSVIHDLRKEGWNIVTVDVDRSRGHYEYVYKRPYDNKRDGMQYEELPMSKSNFFENAMRRLKIK